MSTVFAFLSEFTLLIILNKDVTEGVKNNPNKKST